MSQTSRLAAGGLFQAALEDSRPATLSTIPAGIPPNGTIAADGTITLVAALRIAYPHCWIYLPAGAVVGGLAGMYYVRMTSTTVGQVFTNYFNATTTEFVPFIPTGTPVLAVGSGSAYTQTTGSTLQIFNKTINGGILGNNGMIRTSPIFSISNNANAKVMRTQFGNGNAWSVNLTTIGGHAAITTLRNTGVSNAQVLGLANNGDVGTVTFNNTTVNTAIDQPLHITGQITVATTDYVFLEAATIEVFPQS